MPEAALTDALRAELRTLTTPLGDVIARHVGRELLALVDHVRQADANGVPRLLEGLDPCSWRAPSPAGSTSRTSK